MRFSICLAMLAILTGCGGGARDRGDARVTQLSSGPIASACQSSGRRAASRQLCGCIQTVANRSLSGSDQRLAVSFFSDPQRAQDVRQSDTPRNEAFWDRYVAFAEQSERLCQGF